MQSGVTVEVALTKCIVFWRRRKNRLVYLSVQFPSQSRACDTWTGNLQQIL